MSEKKSFLTTVDVFLTKSRKVLVNIVTAFFLLLITIFMVSFFVKRFGKKVYKKSSGIRGATKELCDKYDENI